MGERAVEESEEMTNVRECGRMSHSATLNIGRDVNRSAATASSSC